MVKTLFLDIDGTLLSFTTHQVPASALAAIRQAQNNGVNVIIATGRPMPLIRDIGGFVPDGYITTNGCACYDRDKQCIYKCPIPIADLQAATAFADAYHISLAFCTEDRVFINRDSPIVHQVADFLHLPPFATEDTASVFATDVIEIIAYICHRREKLLHHYMPHCVFPRWHKDFTDVIHRDHSKETGIDRMLDFLGADLSETMAVGDGGNDKEMLQHAAIGVAMGNAVAEVKQYADYTTGHVDEGGLAQALEKFVL